MQESYIYHSNLFNSTYFERVLSDEAFPRKRELPSDARDRLKRLLILWLSVRSLFVKDLPESKYKDIPCVGLPSSLEMKPKTSEDNVENRFLLPLYEEVLSFACEKQQSMESTGLLKEIKNRTKKPDLVIFSDEQKKKIALDLVGKTKKAVCALSFCPVRILLLTRKNFQKGLARTRRVAFPKKAVQHRILNRFPVI